MQSIVERQDRAPRDSSDDVDAALLEHANHQVRSSQRKRGRRGDRPSWRRAGADANARIEASGQRAGRTRGVIGIERYFGLGHDLASFSGDPRGKVGNDEAPSGRADRASKR
jgi:hypothetical protein